jgi:cytochrome oxidase Cu insertion factor (SCO1/SenC/PrrC family)
MRASHLLKGAGRTALLAGLLLSGPAVYFGTMETSAQADADPAASDKVAQADASPAHGAGGHGAGHGDAAASKPEDSQTGGHGSSHGEGGYGAHSGWPEPHQLGGDFSLTDHTGRKVTLADFKGKATAFYFGYTQCDDICPIIGTKLGMAVDLMGDKGDQINIAMVSVDDRNDGPKELAAFVVKQHPRLIGLSGNREEIYQIAAKYRVRRDYVMTNQVAKEGEQPAEEHGNGHGSGHGDSSTQEQHGGHGTAGRGSDGESGQAIPASAEVVSGEAAAEAPRKPGQRIKIRSASDDATRLHNMAMAHTTHIYLLNREGQVVRYIYPSMTPENLAKRLTDLVDAG